MRELISALPPYLGVASEVNSMGIPAVPFSGLALLALAAISITVALFVSRDQQKRCARYLPGDPTGDQDLVKRLRRMKRYFYKEPEGRGTDWP